MDEILFEALSKYFHALELRGYMSKIHSMKLLVLSFYRDFVFKDYRGMLSKRDYCFIEKALDCLYGTSCLIPYPDYLKMGKLYLGQISEVAERLRNVENKEVVKVMKPEFETEDSTDTDIMVVVKED